MEGRYWALVDVDNCYVSCERSFRPDLNGKVVVVLSNNDGCVVARSNEAKKLGIKEGTPYFQLAQLFPGKEIYAFSSNYELYGDMTRRLMNIVRNNSARSFIVTPSTRASACSTAWITWISRHGARTFTRLYSEAWVCL